jgi:PAS domain S-box-containing protein
MSTEVLTDVEQRLQFEAFIADTAVRLGAEPLSPRLEHDVEEALRRILGFFGADRCALLGGTAEEALSWIASQASADGTERPFGDLSFAASFPWHFETLCGRTDAVSIASLDDLPREAATDRESGRAMGARSMLTVRVSSPGRPSHCLLLQSVRQERAWPRRLAARLPVITRVLVNALDRKRAEETRGQVQAWHEGLLESAGAIIWRADPRTFQTTFVSQDVERIFGYPQESWLRVPGFWVEHIHPDDRAWVVALSGDAVARHRKHDFEYRLIVADGRTLWMRNIVNVLVADGQATDLVGITVDITGRKHAEFEAAHLRHQLTHAGRVTSLGELAATLAHELNQPLGAIVSNAEAAQVFLGREPVETDAIRPVLDDIARDGQRAGAIVHRVRTLLRKKMLEMRPLDVHRLVDEVFDLARPLAQSRHIDLSFALSPGLPTPSGDMVEIQQVLINLIFNAMDAVSDPGVPARHVSVAAEARDDSTVEFSVRDTGCGLPPDTLPQAFEPFFTTKANGMGMGLAICRTIVESHGGEISIANNPDGGATVRFTLPMHDGQPGERT